MSDQNIQAIKEAQCNFLSFLWKHLIAISELETMGEYYEALDRLTKLIKWMPEDFQNKFGFREKIVTLFNEVQEIQDSSATHHLRDKHILDEKNRLAKKKLEQFIPEFAVMLDRKGYMEKKGANVEYGTE